MKLHTLLESDLSVVNLKEFVDAYPKFCKKWGITENAKELGNGMNGIVYDIGKKRILKLTQDLSEAKASAYIMDKNLKYTWDVYYVGDATKSAQKITGNPRKFPIYIIIGEKLEPISETERKLFNRLYSSLFRGGTDAIEGKPLEKMTALPPLEHEKKYYEWEYAALKELKKVGIKFHDNHGGNIMKSGDSLKFVDLGVSKSSGQVKPIEEKYVYTGKN